MTSIAAVECEVRERAIRAELAFFKSNLQQGFKKPEGGSSSPEKDGHHHHGITHGAAEASRHVLHAAGHGLHAAGGAGSYVLDHASSAQHHAEALLGDHVQPRAATCGRRHDLGRVAAFERQRV